MALPTDIATLYAWYKAGSLALSPGDEVATWLDSSGNGRTMTGATGGTVKPKYRTNQLAGYPAVELTASDQSYFNHASFGWLANLASHTIFIVWKAKTSGTGGIVTSENGSASEAIYQGSDTEIRTRWYNTVPTGFTAVKACPINEWHYACAFQNAATQIGISVDGGSETTTGMSGTRSAGITTVGRIGLDGGAYANGYLAEVVIYSSSLSSGDKTLVNTYLRDKYFSAAPGQQEQIRDAMSRRLWALRRAPGIFEVMVPLWLLDANILDRLAVEARIGPAPAAAGWGGKKWQRRPFSIQRISDVNPATNSLKIQLLDRRPLDVLLWDTARTDKRNSSARQDGVARLSKTGVFAFARLSKAWIENPSDPTSVVGCAQTERALTTLGELLEEARTNEIAYSSFVGGTTGVTLTGTGVNGSSIAVDTTDLLFDVETTPNSLKFTAGSPHTANLSASWTTASIVANTKFRFSVDHKTDSGEALYWTAVRNFDAQQWNDTSATWVGSATNLLATVSTRDAGQRQFSKQMDIGANASTVTLYVFLLSGGTAGRISHLYHVQLEKGKFPTSRVVSDGSAGVRVKTELSHPNPTAAKIYQPDVGTFFCTFVPDWSSSDLSASADDQIIFQARLNSNTDADRLYYDAANARWVFSRTVSGGESTYSAFKAGAVTRGAPYRLAARWTGVEGELGLTAYTLSVFEGGIKGTDSAAAATVATNGDIFVRGSNYVFANQCNGLMGEIRIFPYALTDEEIARLP